jgi:hypothetical protein
MPAMGEPPARGDLMMPAPPTMPFELGEVFTPGDLTRVELLAPTPRRARAFTEKRKVPNEPDDPLAAHPLPLVRSPTRAHPARSR